MRDSIGEKQQQQKKTTPLADMWRKEHGGDAKVTVNY